MSRREQPERVLQRGCVPDVWRTATIAERFAARTRVTEGGCWEWIGAKDGHGYGQMRIDRKSKMATHVSLELAGYPRLPIKPCALHKCDNPSCVNPDHLWWGTMKENIRDAMAKGRMNISGLAIGHALSTASKREHWAACANCSVEFRTTKARLAVNKRNFCNVACCSAWQRRNFTGAKRGAV